MRFLTLFLLGLLIAPDSMSEEDITGREDLQTDIRVIDTETSESPQDPATQDSSYTEEYLTDDGIEISKTSTTDISLTGSLQREEDLEDRTLQILGQSIGLGETRRLYWVAGETLYGSSLYTPIYITRGRKPGLTLCLTAAVHGDELNGIEIVRSIMESLDPADLSGTVIGVPIVNLLGFTRGTRYLPDRRDLNRYFPGNQQGSAASRIAYSFFDEVIRYCDRLVDLHTGSLNRTNLPQLRANLNMPEVLEFTSHFGSTAVLHSRNIRGNLRNAAVSAGIPAVTFELGEPGTLQENHIEYGIKAIETLLDKLDMVNRRRTWSEPQPVYYKSRWIRVNNGGLFKAKVKVGARVKKGTVLGTIINPLNNDTYRIISTHNGRVLGMALNQYMLPGYAAFHVGIVTKETDQLLDPVPPECDWGNQDDQMNEEMECNSESIEDLAESIPDDEAIDEYEPVLMDENTFEEFE